MEPRDKRLDNIDVLVCGGGCAGLGAAVQAARSGARVLLVEKNGFAGGFITSVMGPHFDGMFDIFSGRPVVGGIPAELLQSLCGITPAQIKQQAFEIGGDLSQHGKVQAAEERISVEFDVEEFKVLADSLLKNSGVEVLYHSFIAGVDTKDGLIESVLLANKGGLQTVRPRVVIDCTGDGDVMAWAGAPFEKATNLQPMTLHMRIAGLDPSAELGDSLGEVLRIGKEEGRIPAYGGPWLMKAPNNDILINTTRHVGDHTNPWDWTRAEIEGRQAAWAMFHMWKEKLPAFSSASLVSTGPEVGARETRRLLGDYQLRGEDILAGRSFTDAVVNGAWYIDRHPHDTSGYHEHVAIHPYDIPYRTMTTGSVRNLLVAGRCHSVDRQAHGSTRVTVTAMGLGQAAGAAAALALHDQDVRSAQVCDEVRDVATDTGLLIKKPSTVSPTHHLDQSVREDGVH